MSEPFLRSGNEHVWLMFFIFLLNGSWVGNGPSFLFSLTYLFLIEVKLLHNVVLASAIHQHESAMGIHVSPPSFTSLPPPLPSHPSRLLQSPGLSSLSHTANSHWLSVLHIVVYMLPCCSLHSPHSLLPPPAHVHKSVLYVCVSTAALEIGSSIPCFQMPHICVNVWYLVFLSDLLHSV